MHGERNYPFRKSQSDLDIALADGTDDKTYLEVLHAALDRAWEHSTPDLVIYISGADPFVGDRLGRLSLTKDGLARRDKMVFDQAQKSRVPLAIAMGGGYAKDVSDIVDIHAQTIDLAYDAWFATYEPRRNSGSTRSSR